MSAPLSSLDSSLAGSNQSGTPTEILSSVPSLVSVLEHLEEVVNAPSESQEPHEMPSSTASAPW